MRPARGHTAQGAGPDAGKAEVQRLEALTDQLKNENRLHSLDVRLVPDAHGAVGRQKVRCDAEMAALKAQKGRAHNNLAGATWEQSISTEMTALATCCDTEARSLADRLASLQREQAGLKASSGK